MLAPWIIKKLREDKQPSEDKREQPRLEIPRYLPPPHEEKPVPKQEDDSYVDFSI